MFDQKTVIEVWTTDRYWQAVLNPDWSLIWWWSASSTMYTSLYFYDANKNLEYIAEAPAGNLWNEALAIWRIKKLTYNVDNNVTAVLWADGNTKFDNICNNRGTIIYS